MARSASSSLMASRRLRMSSNSPATVLPDAQPPSMPPGRSGVPTWRRWFPAEPHPPDLHEYVSFDAPTSTARGCSTSRSSPARGAASTGTAARACSPRRRPSMEQGCCSYGAHFVDEDDANAALEAADRLTTDQWQHRRWRCGAAGPSGGRPRAPSSPGWSTAPASSSTGPGSPVAPAAPCTGRPRGRRAPLDWKPDVCWQLPLRLSESDRRLRAGDLDAAGVEAARLGCGRPRVPLVVHRGTRCLRGRYARLRRAAGRDRGAGGHVGVRPVRRARRGAGRRPARLASSTCPTQLCADAERRSGGAQRVVVGESNMHHDAWSSPGSAPHSAQGSSSAGSKMAVRVEIVAALQRALPRIGDVDPSSRASSHVLLVRRESVSPVGTG